MKRTEGTASRLPSTDVRQLDLEQATVEFDRRWQQSLLRPLALSVMMGCVVTAATYVFVVLVDSFTEGLANVIIVCSVLAALTACVVDALTYDAGRDIAARAKFRVMEPVGWILALRIGLWIVGGDMPSLVLLLTDPLPSIFNGVFVAGILLVLLSWVAATVLNRSLLALALQEDEVDHITRAYGSLSAAVENTLRSDRKAMLDRFIAAWIAIGILIIILVAGTQVELPDGQSGPARPTIRAQNIHPRAIVSMIVYFFCGFLVVGQSHLVALRARWALDGLAVDRRRFRSWMMYVVGLLAAVALITSLVPIGETVLLFRALMAVATVVMAFMRLVLGALGWLLNLVNRGSTGEGSADLAPMEMPELLPEEEEEAAQTIPNFQNAPEVVFWVLVSVAALIGVYHLLAARGFNWSWILERLRALLGQFQSALDAGVRAVRTLISETTGLNLAGKEAWERKAPANMTMDQRVQFAYLSLLDRTAQLGFGRRASETPRRYGPRLANELDRIAAEERERLIAEAESEGRAPPAPEENKAPDVEGVTQSFYRARYSPEAAASSDLNRIQALLRRVQSLWGRRE